jgi:hypothetical protein
MDLRTWKFPETGVSTISQSRRINNNDLHGNIHPGGLLDQSGARDRIVSANLPAQANR